MPNELRIDGLEEFAAALRQLPEELTHDAAVIVRAQADEAMRQMFAAYPVDSGQLRRGLRLDPSITDRGTTLTRVRNRTWYAALFEFGTKGKHRHWRTGKDVGPMPAGQVFVPIAQRRRIIMVTALMDMVRRAGLTVAGFAGEL
jgi:Bacteriophage HK97-gp10, putative tail-component